MYLRHNAGIDERLHHFRDCFWHIHDAVLTTHHYKPANSILQQLQLYLQTALYIQLYNVSANSFINAIVMPTNSTVQAIVMPANSFINVIVIHANSIIQQLQLYMQTASYNSYSYTCKQCCKSSSYTCKQNYLSKSYIVWVQQNQHIYTTSD